MSSFTAFSTSLWSVSKVSPRKPYIKSTDLFLMPVSSSASKVRAISSRLCTLPTSCRICSSKLCSPMLTRLIPCFFRILALSRSNDSGFISKVNSFVISKRSRMENSLSSCCSDKEDGVPPPMYAVSKLSC